MKTLLLAGLASIYLFIACTTPSPSDFQSKIKPLATNDLMVLWRFPHYAITSEIPDISKLNSPEHEQAMDPLFQQLIPRIFGDAKSGTLNIYQVDEDISVLAEQPIPNLAEEMKSAYNAGWQNLSPLMGAFHLIQRRKVSTKGFSAQELEIMIITQDPENKGPERYFGSVRIADLVDLGYKINLQGESYELIDYLEKTLEYAYPIHYMNTEMTQGLYSIDVAFKTKEMLLNGQWNSIEWLGGEPNLSGKKMKPLSSKALQKFAGSYRINPKFNPETNLTKGGEEIQLNIVVEEEHLMANWSNQNPYFMYLMFPQSTDEFFTVNGDAIRFSLLENGEMQILISVDQKTDIKGYRQ